MSREIPPRRETTRTQRYGRGSQPQLRVMRTDVPAVEKLQRISDIVRKLISKMGRLRPTIDLSEPRGLTLCRVDPFHHPVNEYPGHDLRVGEVATPSAHLPNVCESR